jgi:hypothetical protein
LAERPAVNASPLIQLAAARLLDFLQLDVPEIVVPRPVADEIRAGRAADAAVTALDTTPWLSVVDPPLEAIINGGTGRANVTVVPAISRSGRELGWRHGAER